MPNHKGRADERAPSSDGVSFKRVLLCSRADPLSSVAPWWKTLIPKEPAMCFVYLELEGDGICGIACQRRVIALFDLFADTAIWAGVGQGSYLGPPH